MKELRAKVAKIIADAPDLDTFVSKIFMQSVFIDGTDFKEKDAQVLKDILERLYTQTMFVLPEQGTTHFELAREKDELERIAALSDTHENLYRTGLVLTGMLKVLHDAMPAGPPSSITAQAMSVIPAFARFVGDLVEPLFWKESIEADVLPRLRKQLWANICIASGMPIDGKTITPRHIWPEASQLVRTELFQAYLKDTPLQRLSRLRVPFATPRDLLQEHTAIFAPSGHGKSQLLQTLVHDLLQNNPPAMFIMDSHGDLIRNLKPLIPKDRLVVLDPETDPPALNLFALSGGMANELFSYLFSALDRSLTEKQLTAVIYALRLLQTMPKPTLSTFLELLNDKSKKISESKYAANIARLDPITQAFFATQYFDKENSGTRQQVANRLFTVLSNPTFERMFNATENTFDAYKAMQAGKIVLVNTSMLTLRQQGSSVFGRYIIAQCLAAAFQRATIPQSQRGLCLLIIDEAAQYFDDTTETILEHFPPDLGRYPYPAWRK